MSLIISENGQNAERLSPSGFAQENYLQQYIYNNPDAVPVYEIDEDIRLLILAREFNTQSGPIDALGVDQNGNIYLIETKLYKNPDKRTVVAQVLDYGASLWSSSLNFTDFLLQLDKHVQAHFDMPTTEKLQEFFELEDDDVDSLIDNMQKNLNSGIFKFVVLMDNLHKHLKDLIVFLNRNSQFDTYAVELEYYKHNQFEIIIPKMFGTEVKKDILQKTKAGRKESNQWLIDFIRTLAIPPYIHLDYEGTTARYFRFTTDTMDTVLPKRATSDGGWKNGQPYMYEIYTEGGFGEPVQIHFELNKDDVTEHESQIQEKIITASGRNTKQYSHWFRGKVWRLDYSDEATLKDELLRVFEQEIPAFERNLLEEIR